MQQHDTILLNIIISNRFITNLLLSCMPPVLSLFFIFLQTILAHSYALLLLGHCPLRNPPAQEPTFPRTPSGARSTLYKQRQRLRFREDNGTEWSDLTVTSLIYFVHLRLCLCRPHTTRTRPAAEGGGHLSRRQVRDSQTLLELRQIKKLY